MKYPKEYMKRGFQKLHSGELSDIFYDVNAMLTDNYYRSFILDNVRKAEHYAGIATGGAIIACLSAEKYRAGFSMVKDGEVKGILPGEDWILIDDVVTTGNSLFEALRLFNTKPKEIFAVVDRRKLKEKLNIRSLFEL